MPSAVQPTKAPSQNIQFPRYVRMKALKPPAPGRLTLPYLKGPRRMFAVEEGFVGVTNVADAMTIAKIQADGEIPERGGQGGPLFDVVDEQGMVDTLSRESEAALLRGTGMVGGSASAALQNLVRLGRSPGQGAIGAAGTGRSRSAAEILEEQQASVPVEASPEMVVTTPPAPEQSNPTTGGPPAVLGARRRGGAKTVGRGAAPPSQGGGS